ncbi:MAG: hypothetical protein V7L11_23885 [Nostoc sp.]|uniref:hypothetical protein n=1 Tax=Nostoc sp. TaxID=1180 RepID=UPI002FF8C4BA
MSHIYRLSIYKISFGINHDNIKNHKFFGCVRSLGIISQIAKNHTIINRLLGKI